MLDGRIGDCGDGRGWCCIGGGGGDGGWPRRRRRRRRHCRDGGWLAPPPAFQPQIPTVARREQTLLAAFLATSSSCACCLHRPVSQFTVKQNINEHGLAVVTVFRRGCRLETLGKSPSGDSERTLAGLTEKRKVGFVFESWTNEQVLWCVGGCGGVLEPRRERSGTKKWSAASLRSDGKCPSGLV